jgi:hypothetical protein
MEKKYNAETQSYDHVMSPHLLRKLASTKICYTSLRNPVTYCFIYEVAVASTLDLRSSLTWDVSGFSKMFNRGKKCSIKGRKVLGSWEKAPHLTLLLSIPHIQGMTLAWKQKHHSIIPNSNIVKSGPFRAECVLYPISENTVVLYTLWKSTHRHYKASSNWRYITRLDTQR